MPGVLESKRTIKELIIETALKLAFSPGAGKLLRSDAVGQATWQDVIPVDTKMLFFQQTAPLGWTLDSSNNDRFLRVVTGTNPNPGERGGDVASSFTLGNAGSHSHGAGNLQFIIGYYDWNLIGDSKVYFYKADGSTVTLTAHGVSDGTHVAPVWMDVVIDTYLYTKPNSGTGSTTTEPNHTHTHNSANHAYANVIICTKD